MPNLKTIETTKVELEKVIDFLNQELNKLHASRVTPSLVEGIKVPISGQNMTIQQLGAISVGGTNQLLIQPWSEEYLQSIEQAITQSNLQLGVVVDKQIIRLTVPDLSQERRENLVVLIGEKANQAKDTVRHWWHEGWDEIQAAFSKDEIGEDEKFKMKESLQKLISEYNDKIDQIKKDKQEEIKG
jgi:ribosome recycling factor